MINTIRAFIISIIAVLLSGCWIPEKFDAKVVVDKDGGYTFSYNGTLTNALVLAAAQQGPLSAKDEAAFKKDGEKLAHSPEFKKVDYLGKGRYSVVVAKKGKPGENYHFPSNEFSVISVLKKNDGIISISAKRPSKKDIQQIAAIGAKLNGTLEVSVASGTKIVKHNAQSQPSLFGLYNSYKWKIESPDVNPTIDVKL